MFTEREMTTKEACHSKARFFHGTGSSNSGLEGTGNLSGKIKRTIRVRVPDDRSGRVLQAK